MNSIIEIPQSAPAQFDGEAALLDGWLHGRPAATVKAYRGDVAGMLAAIGKALREITVPDMQEWVDSLAGQAPASRARRINAVRSFLKFSHRVGYLTFDPSPFIRAPKVKDRLAERIVDRDAIRDLLRDAERQASPRDRAMLLTAYYGALRISELVGLEWRHARARDGGQCQISVMGKGGSTRVILLPARAAGPLLALRGDAGDDDAVFASRESGGRGHLDASQAHRIIKAAAARAGLPEAFSAHWLRHASASHALDAGAPVHVVQQTLGHASLATTSKYTHARPGDSAGLYLDRV